MPRYVVERTFADGFGIPAGAEGAEACRAVVERNEYCGVTWLHSYVSQDGKKTLCVYDGPSPEAARANVYQAMKKLKQVIGNW